MKLTNWLPWNWPRFRTKEIARAKIVITLGPVLKCGSREVVSGISDGVSVSVSSNGLARCIRLHDRVNSDEISELQNKGVVVVLND